MCGLCTETITFSFIEQERKGLAADFSYGFRFNYLQECDQLINNLRSLSLPEINSIEAEVIIFKVLEFYIEQGFKEDVFADLLALTGPELVTERLGKLKTFQQDDEYWRELGNIDLYTHASHWAGFIGNIDYARAKALDVLLSYAAWCHEQEEQEPPGLSLPGDADKAPEQDEQSYWHEHFHDNYPLLFFSIAFLGKHDPRADVLKDIALVNPPLCDFLGYDLWLQRKAFLSCVKTYGVDFIIDNFSDIRYELIYYAALKIPFNSADRAQLRQRIAADKQHFTINYDADHVLELLA